MRILLDVSNLGATGPEILLRNLLSPLAELARDVTFLLLLPSSKKQEIWELPPNVKAHFVHRSRIREFSRMWDINFALARLSEKLGANLYFTFGDLGPAKLSIPHIIYLHQAYMVYTEPELNNSLPLSERIKLRYQRSHFSRSVRNASAVVVQTPVVAARLIKLYGVPFDKVSVIRPPLPSHVQKLKDAVTTPAVVGKTVTLNLLFLATYYAHKNHAILPGVVKELRHRNLTGKVHIHMSLDGNRRKEETVLLSNLAPDRDIITNMGRLTPNGVRVAFASTDALFQPTLVETFGLIYLEAMAAGKPILTSDRDFSRYVCGDLALYFDPHDPVSIVDAIEHLMTNLAAFRKKVRLKAGGQISSVAGTPESNALELMDLFRKHMPKT